MPSDLQIKLAKVLQAKLAAKVVPKGRPKPGKGWFRSNLAPLSVGAGVGVPVGLGLGVGLSPSPTTPAAPAAGTGSAGTTSKPGMFDKAWGFAKENPWTTAGIAGGGAALGAGAAMLLRHLLSSDDE